MSSVMLNNKDNKPILGEGKKKDGVYTSKINLYGPHANRPFYFGYSQTSVLDLVYYHIWNRVKEAINNFEMINATHLSRGIRTSINLGLFNGLKEAYSLIHVDDKIYLFIISANEGETKDYVDTLKLKCRMVEVEWVIDELLVDPLTLRGILKSVRVIEDGYKRERIFTLKGEYTRSKNPFTGFATEVPNIFPSSLREVAEELALVILKNGESV